MHQRSADWFLGVPFNIASYALLTHIIARMTERTVRALHMSFGDAHIYTNHFDACRQQLTNARGALPESFAQLQPLPLRDDAGEYAPEDLRLVGYKSCKRIKAPISV